MKPPFSPRSPAERERAVVEMSRCVKGILDGTLPIELTPDDATIVLAWLATRHRRHRHVPVDRLIHAFVQYYLDGQTGASS